MRDISLEGEGVKSGFEEIPGELDVMVVADRAVSGNRELDVVESLRLDGTVGSDSRGRFEFCSGSRDGALSESRRSGGEE